MEEQTDFFDQCLGDRDSRLQRMRVKAIDQPIASRDHERDAVALRLPTVGAIEIPMARACDINSSRYWTLFSVSDI